MTLSVSGQNVLRAILDYIDKNEIVPSKPETYVGYKQIHDALGLIMHGDSYGNSLKHQGLEDLAKWTIKNGHPAITGLVVNQTRNSDSYLQPGHGYFDLYGKNQNDFSWWNNEITNTLNYNWTQFLPALLSAPPPLTQEAVDFEQPQAGRVKSTTYRILRDTELARRVKVIHNYCCQICGHTIQLSDGSRYAEAHHIQPLGTPHNGPDIIGNILCLCPNHHAELDYRVVKINLTRLHHSNGHSVDQKYVDYHNEFVH